MQEKGAMHTPEKSNFFLLLLNLLLFFSPSSTLPTTRNPNPTTFCGKIRIKTPLSLQQYPNTSSSLSHILLCKSKKLYFRTSLGLFPVSSIDYKAKTLTISHSSCSPASHFISPSLISAGLPSTQQPNSLLLFNCSSRGQEPISSFLHNCSSLYSCSPQEQEKPFSCLFVNDAQKLNFSFHPKDLSCSHYRRVYRSSSSPPPSIEGFEFGTRVSFDVPDHLPPICDECSKPNGNCGIGLRCICHAKECSKFLEFYKLLRFFSCS